MASDGRCKLGDLNASGITIPITVTPGSSASILTLTTTATAQNAASARTSVAIQMAPAPSASPSSARSPQVIPSLSMPPVIPPAPSASTPPGTAAPTIPSTAVVLPEITPGPITPPQPTSSTAQAPPPLTHIRAASASLAAGQTIWLLILVASIIGTALVLPRRRRPAIRGRLPTLTTHRRPMNPPALT